MQEVPKFYYWNKENVEKFDTSLLAKEVVNTRNPVIFALSENFSKTTKIY